MQQSAIYKELGLLARSQTSLGSSPDFSRHAFHPHPHLWDYCNPDLAAPFVGQPQTRIWESPPAGTTLAHAMARTRLLVFLGAGETAELRQALERTDGVCLVFEPCLERLEAFLAARRPRDMANRGVFFIGGDPDALEVPLLAMLPENLCDLGYPVCFAGQGLPEALPEYARRVEEMVELLYYRNVIYRFDSQEHVRGLPIRPMTRLHIFDRLKHLYENLHPCLHGGVLSDVRSGLAGRTAMLCAAGPALAHNMDYIRENSGRAVVIAVNSALKPLAAAGITPHFVVINDTSVDSEPTLTGLPDLPDTHLVAHCLSTTGEGRFGSMRFFGNFPGQPFPKRPSLLLHGSVITTAFSLAEYLGCSQVLLAGVQLSSPDPYHLNYAAGSQHGAQASGLAVPQKLKRRWPELYPVTAADGSQVFTTLNFFDSAQWFADRIRQAAVRVVNLCPQSILTGPGIFFDPAPVLPPDPGIGQAVAALPVSDQTGRAQRVTDYIRQEMARWKTKQLAARQAGASLGEAQAFIAASDEDNTSFMLQRFEDFDNRAFHQGFFDTADPGQRLEAARGYLTHMENMCSALLRILLAQHKRIAG